MMSTDALKEKQGSGFPLQSLRVVLDPVPERDGGFPQQFWGLDINMDGIEHYIWERRIHHGVRYQKSAVPFPDSVEIGLEFNAALERKDKLDMCLLTNSVMLELCEFAKTVTRSEMYFLFEILEFNFDLGMDTVDEWQCYDLTKRVHTKIRMLRDQIKFKPHRWLETFLLPPLSIPVASAGSEQSERYYPKRNTVVDSSVLTGGSKNSESAEHQDMESSTAAIVIKKQGGVRLKSTADAYPHCKDLGVTLVVRPDNAPKEKLDPNLITNGVMMELLDFSRVLCGTHTGIVCDLVKQNFGYELVRTLFRVQVARLMERKYACQTPEDKSAFRKEVFQVQLNKREQKPKKRKDPDTDYQELEEPTMASNKREMLRLEDDDAKDICQESDLSYMCPVDFEAEMQSGSDAEPENVKFESSKPETKFSLDVKEEEEEVFVSPRQPEMNVHNPYLFEVCPKDTTLKEIGNLFSEDKNEDMDVKTYKQKLWIRRAPRSKEILKSSRVNDMFAQCRARALDFNIGSGSKQNVDLQLFTNQVLYEVYKFALAMTKSSRNFLFDILGNNFNLFFHNEVHQRNFTSYMFVKEKILQNHPDRWKMEFLSSPFHLPEVYNMVDVTSDFQTRQEAETEQQTNGDSQPSDSSQQEDMEPHPFCKKFGLNLWSTEERLASQKLDLTVLTSGAVLEIFAFIRELCGSLRELVNDILEHNFDLDLQSGLTEASQVIQRWYSTQKSLMRKYTSSPKVSRWFKMVVPLNGHLLLDPEPQTANSLEDLDSEDSKPEMEALDRDEEIEEKKVIRYHFCEEIGLDLDVNSKPGKTKLDLGVLTRGVLLEMHQYVERNCSRYVPALYEILEYNFDLSPQGHRRVEFAWSIAAQVIAIAGKNGRNGEYLNKVIELPFEVSESSQIVCKEEPEDGFGELDLNDNNDIVFVRELKPVDIEVEID
ncbi:uncharacterized protein LOC125898743 [Epinephelus fuscoguttatus]|uniref:uncharacterized protein LOC125898743 n=1 Tax=Epinephelus fuscoguttatus TaxID=293821 RepID=UPI0020D0C40F|nr:uncharacterized protein LOC125898743 [Epinephelus fuscoguttatus]XP_049448627.1 uncharacterized protein LOC125898743 [Epinephelus fuscoguttatus]